MALGNFESKARKVFETPSVFVGSAGVCREGGTAAMPPGLGGVRPGSFIVRATGGSVDELGSGDELHKVPCWERAYLGKLTQDSVLLDLSQGLGAVPWYHVLFG